MIVDDLKFLENRKFDVCVVGSGLVGSCLALDLAHRGHSVLVIESGIAKADPLFQKLSDASIALPQYHHPMSVAVSRALGGTSALWGGRCVLFDEIDFLRRDYIPNSGWPISHRDVAKYERRAAELLGCDDGGFRTYDLNGYAGSEIDFNKLERWVNETRIIIQQPELKRSDRIVVLLNGTVIGIDWQRGAPAIKGIKIAREGRSINFRGARDYILAMGGIETARLLLNMQKEHPLLFGGEAGPLGRYYMGHLSGSIANLRLNIPTEIALFDNLKGVKSFARRRLSLSPETQLQNRLPNIAFWPDNPALFDSLHGSGFLSLAYLLLHIPKLSSRFMSEAIRELQTRHHSSYLPHLQNLVKDFEGMVAGVFQSIQQRYVYHRRLPRVLVTDKNGCYPLHFHAEQSPNGDNRISLTEDVDQFGMNRVSVDFRFGSSEFEKIRSAHKVFDGAIRHLGFGELLYVDELTDGIIPSTVTPDGLHQIGSTRMSDNPSTGVVDGNCRVFGFENLYVAGSSVFPTGSQASPTLPAVALSMRLSEHLERQAANTNIVAIGTAVRGSRQPHKKMRILFVTASYYPAVRYGGPIYTVHSLARALVQRGHTVSVYTTNVDGDRPVHSRSGDIRVIDGVRVHYFSAPISRIYWSRAMIKSLRKNIADFDLVHAQGAFLYPTVAARRETYRARIPFVYSPRGMLVNALIREKNHLAKSVWIRLYEIANCEQASFLHATSEVEAQDIRSAWLRPRLIEVVSNGVDKPDYISADDDKMRRERFVGSNRPYIIVLGRVSWKKGIDRLIRAMSLVPDINLVVAGNDEENFTPRLQSLSQDLGLRDRIVFTGPVYGVDKFALLRGAELFVLPSYSESFGVVVLEALSCGCPVVMTPEIGIAQELKELGAGVIARGVPEELAKEINELLKDEHRRARMSKIGSESVLGLYSWDGIAENMEEAYIRAITNK
jgi:glycosyltransferase involved in cell wall biosynthesis/choline dehydrogenase-like flavoprotein